MNEVLNVGLIELRLLSRTYCHLCEEMKTALLPLIEGKGVGLVVVDVDSDPALEERYGESVPVLLHEEHELCRHVLDAAKVRDHLDKIR